MDQEIQSMLQLTFSNSIEAADGDRRIISGKIAPYNEVGYTSAGPVVSSVLRSPNSNRSNTADGEV